MSVRHRGGKRWKVHIAGARFLPGHQNSRYQGGYDLWACIVRTYGDSDKTALYRAVHKELGANANQAYVEGLAKLYLNHLLYHCN